MIKNCLFLFLSAACPKEPFSKEKTEKKKADILGGAWGRRTISPGGWRPSAPLCVRSPHATPYLSCLFIRFDWKRIIGAGLSFFLMRSERSGGAVII